MMPRSSADWTAQTDGFTCWPVARADRGLRSGFIESGGIATLTLTPPPGRSLAGSIIRPAGNVDGDGFADFLITGRPKAIWCSAEHSRRSALRPFP